MHYLHAGIAGLVVSNILFLNYFLDGEWEKIIPYNVIFLAFMLFQYFSIGNPKFGQEIHSEEYYLEQTKLQLNFKTYLIIKQIFLFSSIIAIVFIIL